MADSRIVTNGGSAIGEAIGHYMEIVVQQYIEDFLEEYPCHVLRETGYNPITRKNSKKLLLYDSFGNDYNIDGIITNESMQPLVLLESKYIRYKKHNRDKGSWICNAHSAIRKRYPSIRASVAVLAGSWSKTSLLMIQSYDVNYFLIPFEFISELLREKDIDFNWGEKEYSKALLAWRKYEQLSEDEKMDIATKMVDSIKDNLFETLRTVLDDSIPREISKVIIEIKTSKGETMRISFDSSEEAIEYLESLQLNDIFNESSFISIFEPPIEEPENELSLFDETI